MTDQSTIASSKPAFPLWVTRAAEAAGLEPGVLMGQIDELLYDGWQPAKVRSKLEIPEQQERSLEEYAKKYRYRRVIAPMTRIREALVAGAEPLSKDCVKLFGLVMQQSLAEGTDEGKRQRAAEIMLEYMDRVERIGQRAEILSEKADANEAKQSGGPAESAEDMLRRVRRDVYGIESPAGGNG
jgi:hypothetical protein